MDTNETFTVRPANVDPPPIMEGTTGILAARFRRGSRRNLIVWRVFGGGGGLKLKMKMNSSFQAVFPQREACCDISDENHPCRIY